jgi:hypothetical protein
MAEVHRQIQNQLEETVSLAVGPLPWVQGADIVSRASGVSEEDWLFATAVCPFGTSIATVISQEDDLWSRAL